MRKHKIVSRERAREEMGEESLNGRVKGARHGCPRRNCVTLMFAKEKKDLLSIRTSEVVTFAHFNYTVPLVACSTNLGKRVPIKHIVNWLI